MPIKLKQICFKIKPNSGQISFTINVPKKLAASRLGRHACLAQAFPAPHAGDRGQASFRSTRAPHTQVLRLTQWPEPEFWARLVPSAYTLAPCPNDDLFSGLPNMRFQGIRTQQSANMFCMCFSTILSTLSLSKLPLATPSKSSSSVYSRRVVPYAQRFVNQRYIDKYSEPVATASNRKFEVEEGHVAAPLQWKRFTSSRFRRWKRTSSKKTCAPSFKSF
jgi:hypothetical protein